uniref:Leishmania mexicana KKT4 n=1 Tax=Leishmania mexicana (strain MHOM/GT/2001/U1103) TaxID=929439 RepID=UPI00186589F8|nr:Chain A, Leishmania mexicana KKT4 [Leishmania mexicana MHOM/GT/2001/U1103]6ZPJ_B Chain B, Leishmania mexicana KKT4 [Leishmania mexicana MHOM/GT/2001/U1103]
GSTANKLTEAQRRIAELEKELQRTTQRVDQLSDVVQQQKDELQAAKDRHALEMEETRHAYNAVIHRKDEVQEEALRQLLKSRQLMVSAARYEAVVAAKKLHAQEFELGAPAGRQACGRIMLKSNRK